MTWFTALDVPGLIFVCVFVALFVLFVLQGRTIVRHKKQNDERYSFLETWGQRTDPRYFEEHGRLGGIHPFLEPKPGAASGVVDCEELDRPHLLKVGSSVCSRCNLDLTPTRP